MMVILVLLRVRGGFRTPAGWRRIALTAAGTLVLAAGVLGWKQYLKGLDVHPTNLRESVGIPSRQLMEVYRTDPGAFTAGQRRALAYAYRNALNRKTTLKDIAERNTYRIADPIKPSFFKNGKDVRKYLRLWLAIGKKRPAIYVDQALKGSYAYWWIGYDPEKIYGAAMILTPETMFRKYRDLNRVKLKGDFAAIAASLPEGDPRLEMTWAVFLRDKPEFYALAHLQMARPAQVRKLQSLMKRLARIPGLSILLTTGFYTWLLLAGFLYLLTRRKAGACTWPILAIIAMACLSPVNGYMRYVLSTAIFSVLLTGICFLPRGAEGKKGSCSDHHEEAHPADL